MGENDSIIDKLHDVNLQRPYQYESAEIVSDLLLQAYDSLSKQKSPEYLYWWQMNQLAQAFSHLCCGWLGAATTSIELSFATDVSQDAWHIEKLKQNFLQIEPHLAGAIGTLRDGNARGDILERYAVKKKLTG